MTTLNDYRAMAESVLVKLTPEKKGHKLAVGIKASIDRHSDITDDQATVLKGLYDKVVLGESSLDDSIEGKFVRFHRMNPTVYETLVKLARDAKARGKKRVGIGMLFEVVRWEKFLATTSAEGFQLNNNFRSRYVRLIQSQEPDLRYMFETRELRAL